jgi:hypothetical protein
MRRAWRGSHPGDHEAGGPVQDAKGRCSEAEVREDQVGGNG